MKRKSNRAYYFPKPEPSALERVLHALFGGGPLSPDYAERGLQLRLETANAPWVLLVGLAALGLGGFVYCLWKLIEGALMLGPLGRIYGASHAVRRQLRKTRKSSTRKPPTPEALEAAWAKSRRSLEWKLRLGIDLSEPFTLEDVLDALSESIGRLIGGEYLHFHDAAFGVALHLGKALELLHDVTSLYGDIHMSLRRIGLAQVLEQGNEPQQHHDFVGFLGFFEPAAAEKGF